MFSKIQQTKLNALSAKNLHRKGKWKYDFLNGSILFLTIIVPLLFIIAQYISKGTNIENIINIISFILSIFLICIAALSLMLKVNDKITTHKVGIKNNLYVSNECDNLLSLSETELQWFFRYVTEIDQQDNDTFARICEKTRRKMYREALKEFSPGDYSITCPLCDSSPWKYKKGDCQLCGNTKK
ncbi:MAG: hypothetical protein A2275_02025 [Bacteroidetes bacterium RIFOXYA12_FULL_35_11]|nr:MAG: hypothetical protein A2X01_04140 [Bacteroidetes bacterium GWF2_35_48]OFY74567.1 MAG: hypothetical protein A2275_02025 [Bacteroidetes bacterium RIFOXYA12_FULL_35_11]OFY94883.1 MAG: hypothetical protein A2309_06725 [Bacteroidetes bacterium RIFOXYB2_FULL_35_7]